MKPQEHIAELLGREVKDRVTGFKGVVSGISFDLYGCVQAVVSPPVGKDGKIPDSRWFDVPRLKVTNRKPVMLLPDFEQGYVAEGRKGAAEKPLGGRA